MLEYTLSYRFFLIITTVHKCNIKSEDKYNDQLDNLLKLMSQKINVFYEYYILVKYLVYLKIGNVYIDKDYNETNQKEYKNIYEQKKLIKEYDIEILNENIKYME